LSLAKLQPFVAGDSAGTKRFSDLYLVVVGSKGWLYERFFQQIEALNAKDW